MKEKSNLKQWKTLETEGYKGIEKICKLAYKHQLFYAIICEPGGGKTLTFRCFQLKHPNVHVIRLTKMFTSKVLFVKMLQAVGVFDFHEYLSGEVLSAKLVHTINKQKDNCLFIFDEAGKFTADMMEYFQPLRDDTQNKMGIILAGPKKFKDKMDRWRIKGELGIPELYTRITAWEEIPPTTSQERYKVARQNGILDHGLCTDISKKTSNFREVYNMVIEARAIAIEEGLDNVHKQLAVD